jgi:hypothetical protein
VSLLLWAVPQLLWDLFQVSDGDHKRTLSPSNKYTGKGKAQQAREKEAPSQDREARPWEKEAKLYFRSFRSKARVSRT